MLDDTEVGACPKKVERAARVILSNSGYQALKFISCRYDEGSLILKGEVPSYYHKHIAQEVTRKMNSVETIVNQIKVWS
jgi:hypothetical protein